MYVRVCVCVCVYVCDVLFIYLRIMLLEITDIEKSYWAIFLVYVYVCAHVFIMTKQITK